MWGSAKIAPRITPAPSHPKVMLPLRLTRLGCRRNEVFLKLQQNVADPALLGPVHLYVQVHGPGGCVS